MIKHVPVIFVLLAVLLPAVNGQTFVWDPPGFHKSGGSVPPPASGVRHNGTVSSARSVLPFKTGVINLYQQILTVECDTLGNVISKKLEPFVHRSYQAVSNWRIVDSVWSFTLPGRGFQAGAGSSAFACFVQDTFSLNVGSTIKGSAGSDSHSITVESLPDAPFRRFIGTDIVTIATGSRFISQHRAYAIEPRSNGRVEMRECDVYIPGSTGVFTATMLIAGPELTPTNELDVRDSIRSILIAKGFDPYHVLVETGNPRLYGNTLYALNLLSHTGTTGDYDVCIAVPIRPDSLSGIQSFSITKHLDAVYTATGSTARFLISTLGDFHRHPALEAIPDDPPPAERMPFASGLIHCFTQTVTNTYDSAGRRISSSRDSVTHSTFNAVVDSAIVDSSWTFTIPAGDFPRGAGRSDSLFPVPDTTRIETGSIVEGTLGSAACTIYVDSIIHQPFFRFVGDFVVEYPQEWPILWRKQTFTVEKGKGGESILRRFERRIEGASKLVTNIFLVSSPRLILAESEQLASYDQLAIRFRGEDPDRLMLANWNGKSAGSTAAAMFTQKYDGECDFPAWLAVCIPVKPDSLSLEQSSFTSEPLDAHFTATGSVAKYALVALGDGIRFPALQKSDISSMRNPLPASCELKIFPVPATNTVTLQNDTTLPVHVEVFDLLGHRVLDMDIGANAVKQVDGLSSGVYSVLLYNAAGRALKKMLVL